MVPFVFHIDRLGHSRLWCICLYFGWQCVCQMTIVSRLCIDVYGLFTDVCIYFGDCIFFPAGFVYGWFLVFMGLCYRIFVYLVIWDVILLFRIYFICLWGWCWVVVCISNYTLGFRVLGIRGRDRVVSELKVSGLWVLRVVGSGFMAWV